MYMGFSGRGFKSHSGQLSIATSKNPSVVNTIYTYIHTYMSRKSFIKKMLSFENQIYIKNP